MTVREKLNTPRSIFLYFVFAFGYVLSGLFLSSLSFQSQIMPVWLPAGIALVGAYQWGWRFLPAVFFASFSFNFSVHPLPNAAAFFSVHGAELSFIALGATIQALVGSALLSRFGNPIIQTSPWVAVKFVFGVALSTNLISANIGIWALDTFNPAFNSDNYWMDALYWWLGDSLGVLLMAPLLLSLKDFKSIKEGQKRARLNVIIGVFMLTLIVLVLTVLFIHLSSESIKKLTEKEVRNIENGFYRELNNSLSQINNLASYIQSSTEIDKHKFNAFVQTLIGNSKTIHGMSWNPLIYQKDKLHQESLLAEIYGREIEIKGQPLSPEDPIVYVKFVSPEKGNEKAIGFNVFSNPSRKATLISAEESFQPKATPIIKLVQTDANVPAYLMFFPIFTQDYYRVSQSGRRLIGYATGIFLVEEMLTNALSLNDKTIFNYELFEADSDKPFLTNTGIYETLSLNDLPDVKTLRFELAGQTWLLNLTPNQQYLIKEQSREYLLLFALEVVITVFVMLFILIMSGGQLALKKLVDEKTESLKSALKEAEKANQAKSRFLANMSHEIRTPLNAVIGFSKIASDTNEVEKTRELVKTINTSASMLMNIVNDILDFSKIESGKLDVEHAPFDIHDVLLRINSIFESAAGEKNIAWHLDNEIPNNLSFSGDKVRIEQILINLCGNAIKFTREGSVSLKAMILPVAENKAKLRVSIKDTGIGIDQATQSKLFKVFTQADDSTTRQFGGSGLGLAISRELSRLMGGDITISSELGKGAEFIFECMLDSELKPETDKVEASNDTVPNSKKESLASLSILVAEDNKINQMLIQHLLGDLGIQPVMAEHGEQALMALKMKPFDAILMDCQMPVMDGYEATKQIRAQAEFAELPIIALTADADVESKKRALASGFTDYLTKPVDPALLESILKKLL